MASKVVVDEGEPEVDALRVQTLSYRQNLLPRRWHSAEPLAAPGPDAYLRRPLKWGSLHGSWHQYAGGIRPASNLTNSELHIRKFSLTQLERDVPQLDQ